MEDEADSASDDNTDSIFEESDDIMDNEELLFDDEERHTPEHYSSAAANLDVTRLRQKRYSPRTQKRLDWVQEQCVKYEIVYRLFSIPLTSSYYF
jgi:hypothetical protein